MLIQKALGLPVCDTRDWQISINVKLDMNVDLFFSNTVFPKKNYEWCKLCAYYLRISFKCPFCLIEIFRCVGTNARLQLSEYSCLNLYCISKYFSESSKRNLPCRRNCTQQFFDKLTASIIHTIEKITAIKFCWECEFKT